MQHVVQGVAEAAQGLLLGDLLGELDGIEGVIQGIDGEWVRIMVLVLSVVKELSHLFLVGLHVEAVAPEDNQAGPGPHQAQESLIERLFAFGESAPKVSLIVGPIVICQHLGDEREGIRELVGC